MKSIAFTLLLLLATVAASAQTVSYFHVDGVLGGIAAGPDGNLWFPTTNGIARMAPAGDVTMFATPAPISGRAMITAGPDGRMWFTEPDQGRVGAISAIGQMIEIPLPNEIHPYGITSGGIFGNVWFGAQGIIGSVTPAGAIAIQRLANNANAADMTISRDNAIWFVESPRDLVGRAAGSAIIGFEKPLAEMPTFPQACCAPASIAPSDDGNVWIAFEQGDAIAKVSPKGTVTQFTPKNAKRPRIVTVAADGTVWFATEPTENEPVRIASMTPDGNAGALVDLAPEIRTVMDMVAGPDGNIWATTGTSSLAIVRVNVAAPQHRRTGKR